jgi:general secretion pathway protein F
MQSAPTPSTSSATAAVAGAGAFIGASRADFALLCRELKTLVQAGMTVVEAVDALAHVPGSHSASLSRQLHALISQGLSLSHALQQIPGAPGVLVAAIRSGERTSNLVEALDDYLQFDVLVSNLRSKLISASIYPLLVTSLGLGISLFLLIVVMPNFSRMYTSLRGGATGSTAVVIQISQWMSLYQTEVILSVVTAIALAVLGLWGSSAAQALVWLERVPGVRGKIDDFRLAMMYQALGLLLKGGYPMVSALVVASQSSLSPRLRQALSASQARIERGQPIAQALHEAGLCDDIGRRLLAAAEKNGDFYRAAQAVSQIYGERFTVFVERLTRIIEPVLLLGVALLVGTIVVMMYLPVFEIATQLR